ncbi:hypothetical protein HD554DRAFT_2038260 [Boletus coccyginus]|nr:hypothetical protein HD554DRAFT_2038260 [Boletus coccyginus]
MSKRSQKKSSGVSSRESGGGEEKGLLTGGGIVISVLIREFMDHWSGQAVGLNIPEGILVTEWDIGTRGSGHGCASGRNIGSSGDEAGRIGLPGREVMEENAGAAERMTVMTHPSLEKSRGVFHQQRGIGVAVGGGTGSGINSGVGTSLEVTAKSSSGVNVPINMDNSSFFLLGSAFLMVMGELCWGMDVVKGNEAIKEWGCSPIRKSVEGEEHERSLEDCSIEEVPYVEWEGRLDIRDNDGGFDDSQ